MVKAGNAVWLVRKISVLSFSVSRKQMRRVVLAGAGAVQCDGLIRDHAAAPVGGRGINPMGIQIGLGTRDEEGTALVQRMQAGEVDIPAIHDVNGTGFGDQHIKSMNIVQLAVRDMDEARDVAAPIEQRVHPHGGFGGPKMGPREHRHAQIDGRGVQRIDGVGQVQAKVFCGVETSGLGDQPLSELSIDAPVARLVGIGERGTVDRIAKAHMVKLRRLGREARLNVPQTLAIGQLCERHDLILRSTGQLSHRAVAVVAIQIRPSNELPKSLMSQKLPANVGSANRTLVVRGEQSQPSMCMAEDRHSCPWALDPRVASLLAMTVSSRAGGRCPTCDDFSRSRGSRRRR